MDRTIEHYVHYQIYNDRQKSCATASMNTKKSGNTIAIALAGLAVFLGLCTDASATMALIALLGAIFVVAYATHSSFALHHGIKRKMMGKSKRAAVIAVAIYATLLSFFIVLVVANHSITWDVFMNSGGFYVVGLPTLTVFGIVIRAVFASK